MFVIVDVIVVVVVIVPAPSYRRESHLSPRRLSTDCETPHSRSGRTGVEECRTGSYTVTVTRQEGGGGEPVDFIQVEQSTVQPECVIVSYDISRDIKQMTVSSPLLFFTLLSASLSTY